jgi:methylmalonyl-CoA mutase N-terminal domain/subunit
MIEKLTADMVKVAEDYIDKIDEMGGALAAIARGYQQREVQESAYRYQREVEKGERVVVGVNHFEAPHEPIPDLLRIDPAEAKKQVARLDRVKKERDAAAVAASLAELKTVAAGEGNTMPAFIRCVEAYATLGEICDVLREVFGTQEEFLIF